LFVYAGDQPVTRIGLNKWKWLKTCIFCHMHACIKPVCDLSVISYTFTFSWQYGFIVPHHAINPVQLNLQIVILIKTAAIEHIYRFSCDGTNLCHWNTISQPYTANLFMLDLKV